MEKEELIRLSKEGERILTDWSNTLAVPSGGHTTGKRFGLEDVKKCFEKMFAIRESAALVGSVAIHGEGNDVDIVLPISDLPEDLQTAIQFRLYRGFADYFGIPYDETPHYLHLHIKKVGQSPFTSWVPLYKLALVPVSQEERIIHQMSLDDLVYDNKDRWIIGGMITTDSVDLEGERISKKALRNIWKHIQKLPEEYLNCMYRHTSIQIGKMIKSYRNHKTALLEDGIYAIAELRHDIPEAQEVWESIQSNPNEWGFSIKITIPQPFSEHIKRVCADDECFLEIEDAMFLEFSLTQHPANPDCQGVEILSK